MNWIKEVFNVKKPIIAMCHLQPLPGDPKYDPEKGMDWAVEMGRQDIKKLQNGGVDAVMFSNEYSLPYLTKTEPITAIAMARIIGELRSELTIPFGVNVLWDAVASIDAAAATGASFVREIFTGVYESDFGLWNTNTGAVARHRCRIHADNVKLLYNIVPEAAAYLAPRTVADIAKTTVFNNRPDALCVSGATAGAETSSDILRQVKEVTPDTAVLVNTGVTQKNVEEKLRIADGAVVGTTFKVDGEFFNGVDEARVKTFMDTVKRVRN